MVPWASNAAQKLFQLSDKSVDWNVAAKVLASERQPQGIVSLLKAELEVKGVAALQKEGLSMQAYAASRTLAVEVLLEMAANRAGVSSVAARRAMGVVLSASSLVDKKATEEQKDLNSFALVARAFRASGGDFRALSAALETELKSIVAALSEDDYKRAAKPAKEGALTLRWPGCVW